MPVPRSRLAAAIVATALGAGAVIVVLAVRAVMADSADDAAWVAVVLGLLCVAWGVGFGRLRDDPSDSGDGAPAAGGAAEVARPSRLRVQGFLATGLVVTGSYVGLRAVGRPIDSALVGPMGYLALRLVNRWVDRLVRRRERRGGDGTGGPAVVGD